MQLTFGMGLFWLLLASTVAEMVVRTAKALGGRRRDTTLIDARVEALERRLEQQARVIDAHESAVGRLEAHADVTTHLIGGTATRPPDAAR